MKVNIENCIRNCRAEGIYKYSLEEFIDNLKELKQKRDVETLNEFFNIYTFDAAPPVKECSTHPDAPHGFNRDASHSAGYYVCDCDGFESEIK